jgi:DUF4097 and DUF4098 domain-containing protein YvlB
MDTFETPEPITAIVEINMGDIHITTSDRTDTVVEVRASDAAHKADIAAAEHTTVDFADGRLRIKSPKNWRQWAPWGRRESIDVHIDMPSGSHVRGSAGAGALQCTGRVGECQFRIGAGNLLVDACGPVVVSAGAGPIDIGRAEGDVDVKTSGSVRIGSIDGAAVIKNSNGGTSIGEITGDLRVNAANGNVIVDRTHGTVVLKCANGDIRLDEADRGAIVAETAHGDVEIGVHDGVAAWLDLNTAFGRVRNDLEAAGPPTPGQDAMEIRARTAFGDITIRRATTDQPHEAAR